MQVEKKEGINLDEVPSFPSSTQPYNQIPLPPKPVSGGLFSKMKGVFSKRDEESVRTQLPLPPPLPEEADPLLPESASDPFHEPEAPDISMPAVPPPVEASKPEPEVVSEDAPVNVEMPEEPPEPILIDPEPEPKKKEYLGNLRTELTQRIKEINQTPIRNKQASQLADEITSHKKSLEELNKELHKINSELSKLNI